VRRAAVTLALAAACAAGGVWYGRHSGPPRVEERVVYRDRVEWRERVVEKRVEGPVRERVVTRTVPGPQGPVREVIREVERGPVTVERNTDAQAKADLSVDGSKVTVREQPRWLVGASAGWQLGEGRTVGGQVMYRVAGPFWLGIAGDSRGHVSAQLAFTK
jgi:hypothetical protein